MKIFTMDVSLLKNSDGNLMVTLAGIGNMNEGFNLKIMDGQIIMTMAVESSPNVLGRVPDVVDGMDRKVKKKEMGKKETLDGVDSMEKKVKGMEIGRNETLDGVDSMERKVKKTEMGRKETLDGMDGSNKEVLRERMGDKKSKETGKEEILEIPGKDGVYGGFKDVVDDRKVEKKGVGKKEILEKVEKKAEKKEKETLDGMDSIYSELRREEEEEPASEYAGYVMDWLGAIGRCYRNPNFKGDLNKSVQGHMTMIKMALDVMVRRDVKLTAQLGEADRKILRLEDQIRRMNCRSLVDSTDLLVRSEVSSDSHLVKMRNSNLEDQLREVEEESARSKEQIKRMCSGLSSPPSSSSSLCKRGDTGTDIVMDFAQAIGNGSNQTAEKELMGLREEERRKGKVDKDGNKDGRIHDGNDIGTGGDRMVEKELLGLRDGRIMDKADKDGNKKGRLDVDDRMVEKELVGLRDGRNVEKEGMEWKLVGGRRKRRPSPLPPPDAEMDSPNTGHDTFADVVRNGVERCPSLLVGQHLKARPKSPLPSAIMISGRTEDFSYPEAMRSARRHIDLKALGIESTRVRKAVNGGLLIEVFGKESKLKAEKLVMQLRGVFKDSAAVSCPVRKREFRISGVDDSVLPEEIAKMVSDFGGCPITDVKVGPIRTCKNSLGTVMVQLPVMAAARLANVERIHLGWTMARVEMLRTRPLQCYRCWDYGHVYNMCRSTVDRRNVCFKCGQSGHLIGQCQNMARCVACSDKGLEALHRFGGPHCGSYVQHSTISGNQRSVEDDLGCVE